jgi:prefoldin subunit 5
MADDGAPAWALAMEERLRGDIARFGADLERLAAEVARLGAEVARLAAEVARLGGEYERLRAELTRTRADIMERIDRLQFQVDSHADDIKVALGAAHMVEDRVRTRDDVAVDRELARHRGMRGLADLLSAMQRQIMRLQAEMAELRGRLGEA